MVVVEEEATDNFGNNNNGQGLVEAAIRADDAIGVAQDFIEEPQYLLITSADSNAGGPQVSDVDADALRP